MIDLSNIKNYYIACGYTDLRRGIDGLAQIVMLQYGYEIDENSLFLFCGRRTDRIKALWFSGDGFVLLYKRLNNGSFQWPRSKDELKLLTPQSFRWLMEGLTTEQKKVIKKSCQKVTAQQPPHQTQALGKTPRACLSMIIILLLMVPVWFSLQWIL